MLIESKKINSGYKYFVMEDGREIARLYLYLLNNELHKRPFGFIEDVFVVEEFRGKSIGSKLTKHLIEEVKRLNCYKVILTSRYSKPRVHDFYAKLGFKDHGKEFRIDF